MAGAASPLGCASLLVFLALLGLDVLPPLRAADTVAAGQPLSGHQKVVSHGGRFALGFFQPDGGAAGRWYVGIWYHNISVQTPVWVANRDRPVSDPATSQLTIAPDGNLVLFDESGLVVWSTNTTAGASDTVVAVLFDTGNLVLAPRTNASSVTALWQSLDDIGDTWIPGGKLRLDKRTGTAQRMVSWRARGDPAQGMYALQLDPGGAPQFVLQWNGTRDYWATGNWTGQSFSGMPEGASLRGESRFSYRFVDNDDESYLTYSYADNATRFRFVMDPSGQIKAWLWAEATQAWALVYGDPKARCSVPRGCGAFGVCNETAPAACVCAGGFSARSPASWAIGDHTGGCVRNAELECGGMNASSTKAARGDTFAHMEDTRFPDDVHHVAGDLSSSDCESTCLANCTCSAYAYNGTCFLWHGDLYNLQGGSRDHVGTGTGTVYLRMAASSEHRDPRSHSRKVEVVVGAVAAVCLVVAVLVLVVHTKMRRRTARVKRRLTSADGCVTGFKYGDLQRLTKNFSDKIGGGAFGSVFKGQLSNLTVVAVKRLEGLRQGEKQFRSEVRTLGTVQHVNLIHLLGFCSDGGDRKMLVYEYMPNGSLDHHLFCAAAASSHVLSWGTRYRIALGVAKGLAYLHDRCRDCIIHCDVKPENILLDAAFAPKVADFGLAKLVGRDISRVLTTARGTIGYLAPEWIGGEAITAKADVYSYGMMLFEMVSGRRNVDHGEAWVESSSTARGSVDYATTTTSFFPVVVARRLAEGDVTTLLDPKLDQDVDADELRRVCKVACWCIQHGIDARPTMSEVVQGLEGLKDVAMPPVPRYLEVIACGT